MPSTRAEVTSALAEMVHEITGVPVEDVRDDRSFADDLDVDSLAMVEIAVAAEQRFAVTITDDQVKNLKTVGDAVDHIVGHQA
ncbi:acyl carrier protein [Streptomyces sp. NPDC058773]|uniref:acyl carrier protein n=1 Tax=Streptomyces sp. NPDC058773 TaxID=3346632 RepID=UPI0036A6A410